MALDLDALDLADRASRIRHLNRAASLILGRSSLPDPLDRENIVMALLDTAEALAEGLETDIEIAGRRGTEVRHA